jgi:hypothetical protein
MKNRVSTDEALDALISAMNEGARPWTLGPEAVARVRGTYQPTFEAQLRRPRAWERESGKVLRLARWAGAVAALLAETDAGPEREPGEVPADHALVGTLAVQHACPIPAPPPGVAFVAGRWCEPPRAMADLPVELMQKATSLFAIE